MKRRLVFVVAMLLVAIFAVTAVAQQQGGSSQFSAMREKYKYTFQLMTMVRHIGEINKDKKYTLTPTQAKSVLGILKPWKTKPKMTQDQAKTVAKNLKKVFTAAQLNAMARIKPHFSQGQRQGGQSGPGGQGNRPNNGGQHRFDPNRMKDFNPFYTKVDKNDPRSAERAKRWNEFFAALEARAKAKK